MWHIKFSGGNDVICEGCADNPGPEIPINPVLKII